MKRNRHHWPAPELKQALSPLADRVCFRYRLETLRLVLTWGTGISAAAVVILKLTPLSSFLLLGGISGAVAGFFVLTLRHFFSPDALAVVRLADELGLNGRAITAYRLLEKNSRDLWSHAAIKEGIAACQNLVFQDTYHLVPSWHPWKGVTLLAGVLLIALWLPASLAPYWQARQAEKEVLAAAAFKAKEVVAQIKHLPPEQKKLVPEKLREELNALPQALSQARNRQEAAKILARTNQKIEDTLALLEPAKNRVQQLANIWQNNQDPHFQKLAATMAKGEEKEITKQIEELEKKAKSTGPGKNALALSFFQAAEAVDDPALRENFRQLARAILSQPENKEAKQVSTGDSPGKSLPRALVDLAQKAGTAASLDQVSRTMFNLTGALATGDGLQPIMAQAKGKAGSGGFNNGGRTGGFAPGLTGAGNNTGAASGSAAGGAGGASTGSGAGGNYTGYGGNLNGPGNNGPGTGGDSANGQGGEGSTGGEGSGSGNNKGNGQAGTGAGGSGLGGQGAGTMGSSYNKVYAPTLIGGSGPELPVSGQIRPGSSGLETGLPNSRVEPGTFRPYQEVYPLYKEEAVNSLSLAPLPPNLEKLVWQYFSFLEEDS
ncbi:MAG: hypothetical protein STSR0004_21460 [Peptococcaceae bacterium]